MLTISTLQPSEPTAQLANYFCRRTAPDFGLHRRTDGSRVLVRSTFDGARRTVERFLMLENFKLKALDRTLFHIDDDRFAETESYRSEQGPNLHAFPIELPGSLVLDQWHVRAGTTRVGRKIALPQGAAIVCATGVRGERSMACGGRGGARIGHAPRFLSAVD